MLSEKDRGAWDSGPSSEAIVLTDKPWLEKQQGALVPQRPVNPLPIHTRALNGTGIGKRKLWLVLLPVSGFVLFGVVLDLWISRIPFILRWTCKVKQRGKSVIHIREIGRPH